MSDVMDGYLSPEEASQSSADQTDKALAAVVAMLYSLYMAKRNIRQQLLDTEDNDEETIGELEFELKLLRGEETSLHRIESGLQSRLSAARAGV